MQNQPTQKETFEEEIDFRDLVKTLQKKGRVIFGSVFVMVALALAYSLLTPKTYITQTAIEIGAAANCDGKSVLLEDVAQVKEKINQGVYAAIARENLGTHQDASIKIKTQNIQSGSIIYFTAESSDPKKSETELMEIDNIIIAQHQKNFDVQEKTIKSNIQATQKNIDDTKNQINSLQKQEEILSDGINNLWKVSFTDKDPLTQLVVIDVKQQLSQRQDEISRLYDKSDAYKQKIADLQNQFDNIKKTQIIKKPETSPMPANPKIIFNIAVGLISGLFIGVFLALYLQWWEKRDL